MTDGFGKIRGKRSGQQQISTGHVAAEMPLDIVEIPRAAPTEAFAIYQTPGAADREILHDAFKFKTFGRRTAIVPPRQPDVSPDQSAQGAKATRPRWK